MIDNIKVMTFEEKADYARMNVNAALSYIGQKNQEENIKCKLDTAMIFLDRVLAEFDEKRKSNDKDSESSM